MKFNIGSVMVLCIVCLFFGARAYSSETGASPGTTLDTEAKEESSRSKEEQSRVTVHPGTFFINGHPVTIVKGRIAPSRKHSPSSSESTEPDATRHIDPPKKGTSDSSNKTGSVQELTEDRPIQQ